jgi:alkyl hydroperoxide reductase subunit AhpC
MVLSPNKFVKYFHLLSFTFTCNSYVLQVAKHLSKIHNVNTEDAVSNAV